MTNTGLPRVRKPLAFNGGNVSFAIRPEPMQATKSTTTNKQVFVDANGQDTFENTGNPKLVAKLDGAGRELFDNNGEPSVNKYVVGNDGSVLELQPLMEECWEDHADDELVFDAEGNPVMDYASISGSMRVIDDAGREHPDSVQIGEEFLTEEDKAVLQGILIRVLVERASAVSDEIGSPFYLTAGQAKAAGAL